MSHSVDALNGFIVVAVLAIVWLGLRIQRDRVVAFWLWWRTHDHAVLLGKLSKFVVRYGDQHLAYLRHRFNAEFGYQPAKVDKNHSHPDAASVRTGVATAFADWIRAAGFQPYSVSKSSRDRFEDGVRKYYFPKDFDKPYADTNIGPNHILTFVDVDYYVDINEYLSEGQPVLLYTFVPQSAGGRVPNGTFALDNDKVIMHVNGGARYEHQLWDYGCSEVVVPAALTGRWLRDWVDWIFGTRTTFVYAVEQRVCPDDPTRRVVFLTPACAIPSWLASYWRFQAGVRRLRTSVGKYSVLRVFGENGPIVSVAPQGCFFSAAVREDILHAAQIRLRESRNKCISDIEKILRQFCQDGDSAALLYDWIRYTDSEMSDAEVYHTGECRYGRHYQCGGELKFEDGKRYVRRVAPSLVVPELEAVAPVESVNNDNQCIKGRVQQVLNTVVPPRRYSDFAVEFVKRVVEKAALGLPWSLSEVEQQQSRAEQQARTEKARCWVGVAGRMVVSAFQKKEVYGSVNDPRNISSVSTDHTLRLSQYTYAFKSQVLKGLPWYMPAQTPQETAERVQKIVRSCDTVVSTDFSRYDGTISAWLRKNVEEACYLRWVAQSDRAELSMLLHREYNAPAFTKNGVRYSPGYSRLSGSPLTTDGNTIINAFVGYCGLRVGGYDPKNAFAKLGCYYGDDGLSLGDHHLPRCYESVAAALGMKLKSDVVVRGNAVPFLGRIFVDPAHTITSVQDPLRTVQKLHLSCAPHDVLPSIAAANRAAGYLVTDALTPIVGEYCRAVKRVFGDGDRSKMVKEDLFKVSAAWPQLPQDFDLMLGVVSSSLGIDFDAIHLIDDQLSRVEREEDFPVGVIQGSIPVKVDAFVEDSANSENVSPPPPVSTSTGSRRSRMGRVNRRRQCRRRV